MKAIENLLEEQPRLLEKYDQPAAPTPTAKPKAKKPAAKPATPKTPAAAKPAPKAAAKTSKTPAAAKPSPKASAKAAAATTEAPAATAQDTAQPAAGEKRTRNRRLTAYHLFSRDEKERISAAEPTLKSAEVRSKVSLNWKNVTKEVREKYEALAKTSAGDPDANGEASSPKEETIDAEAPPAKKAKKVEEKGDKPEKAVTRAKKAQDLFSEDSANRDRAMANLKLEGKYKAMSCRPELKRMFGELSEAAKKKWTKLEAADEVRYQKELAASLA